MEVIMNTRTVVALLSIVMSISTLSGCQSGSNTSEPAPTAEQNSSQDSQSAHSYTLDTNYCYQGVSIKGDASWSINQPKDYNYYVHIDKPNNSHITIQTALHGQTKTLTDAWAEYTNASDGPETIDSWESDGVIYNTGCYDDSYLMMSGYESATGKGFLLWITFDTDSWTSGQAEKLFEGIVESLTYDPSQTTIDYKDAFRSGNSQDTPNTGSGDPGSSSESNGPSETTRYGEGMYKIGTDMPTGEYKLTAEGSSSGYWEVTVSSAADADIVGNDNFSGSTYVAVTDGQYLKLNQCYAEPVS